MAINWWRLRPLQVILLLACLQLSVTLLTDGFALSFDEAMWHYIGRNWFRHGMVPYTGGVDNKSPLIFAVFGISDKLFGLNYWFPRVLGTILQSIGILYIYKIAKHLAGERAGMLAISFYGLSLLWHGTGGRYVAFTETYDMLFIILAFYRYLTAKQRQDFFIAGLLAGVGLGFRLSAVWGIAAILIRELRKSRINALIFCSGVLTAILLLFIIGLVFHIDPHSILTYALTDNFGSGSTTDHNLLWKLVNFSDKFFYSELILFYPFVLGYFFIKKRLDLFGLWLILGFIGVNIVGIYGVMHIRELLPAMSLMSAFTVSYLIEKYHVPPKQLMIIIWIVFFPKLLEPVLNLKKLITRDHTEPAISCGAPFDKPDEGARKKLGQWIRDNTGEKDKVFVAGFGAQVQAYSERVSPTIYFNVSQTRIAKERYFLDLKKNKPTMVLVPLFSEYTQFVSPDMRQYLDTILAKDYRLDRCMYNYNIYRIKDKSPKNAP
jgi:hypothetical protein